MHSIPVDRRQTPIKLTPIKPTAIGSEPDETPQLIRNTQTIPPSTYDPTENEDSTPAIENSKGNKRPLFKFAKGDGSGKEKIKEGAKKFATWFKHNTGNIQFVSKGAMGMTSPNLGRF